MEDSGNNPRRMAVHSVGTGPPLVLFHGGMGSWNHWIRNLDALAGRFRVHAVDLPGYGDAAAVDKSLPRQAYVELVVRELQSVVGSESFCLAGFSFGGVVAAMTAASMGAQVSKISLIGGSGFGPAPALDLRAIPPESAGDGARRAIFRHNLHALMIADPAAISEHTIDLHAENFKHTRYDGRGFSLSNDTAMALERIACPIQFIYGGRDALHHSELTDRVKLVQRLHPHSDFVVVPGAGHWVQYEAAAQVNRLLLAFMTAAA
jgi:pimeloyl-ACP methyl ester carboxylesterase